MWYSVCRHLCPHHGAAVDKCISLLNPVHVDSSCLCAYIMIQSHRPHLNPFFRRVYLVCMPTCPEKLKQKIRKKGFKNRLKFGKERQPSWAVQGPDDHQTSAHHPTRQNRTLTPAARSELQLQLARHLPPPSSVLYGWLYLRGLPLSLEFRPSPP
jgi:hypothetical protein